MQDSLVVLTRHWRQSVLPGCTLGPSQYCADGALAESISSSLRLPTAKAIFGGGIEAFCSILIMRANFRPGFIYFGT